MRIAVHGKEVAEAKIGILQSVFDELKSPEIEVLISNSFHEFVKSSSVTTPHYTCYDTKNQLSGVDYLFSIGGDGTLLESVTHVRNSYIPILGINTGRLGFLATSPPHDTFKIIEKLKAKEYTLEDRTLIHLDSSEPIFGEIDFALNEFAILKTDTSSMITVHTYVNGAFLNSYWADGLIVSTPTGSTGYSLSCGGPIVLPHSNNFIITPVSPHNLSVRSLVVSDSSVLSFEIEGRGNNFLASLDSRSVTVSASIDLSVRKENFCARLLKIDDQSFLDTLRNKLGWGNDVRN
jgi:NAD+ kinase